MLGSQSYEPHSSVATNPMRNRMCHHLGDISSCRMVSGNFSR